jgi:hypothetical protein
MITVSIEQLVSAIEDAGFYTLPDMTEGAEYLYSSLYRRLSFGESVRLSEISYDSFELDDVDSMREIYTNNLEANEYKSSGITHTLRGLTPVTAAAAFV